jgi:NADH dehydrogenase
MNPRAVVIGAGYAGLSAANRLTLSSAEVTLINPRADFVERIRLHQLVAGNRSATVPLTSLLAPSVTFIQDTAELIDPDRQTVRLGTGRDVGYDYLIYAPGSRNPLDVIPGASEHAVTMGDLESALAMRERLEHLPPGATVTIIGGGLTGLEMAAELAETSSHTIRLVTSGPVAVSIGDKARNRLRRDLTALGVDLIEDAAVTEVQPGKLLLAGGHALDSDLSVMTARSEVPTLARDSGLAVAPSNALRVDRTLVSVSAPNIIGAGDASHIDDAPLRPSAQAAIPVGAHAADTVRRLIKGTKPKPVRPKFIAQIISLGRHTAVAQISTFSDRPTGLVLTGRTASRLKETFGTATVRLGMNSKYRRFAYHWTM